MTSKPEVMGSNAEHEIEEQVCATNEDKSRLLNPEELALVNDAHVKMALRLDATFGLRREEAIKFSLFRVNRGDPTQLKG